MHRTRLVPMLLAVLLVLALPVEQVTCACGLAGTGATRTSGMASRCHAPCCAAAAARAAGRHAGTPAPRACSCSHVSAGDLPAAPAVAPAPASGVAFAVTPSPVVAAAPERAAASAPAPDVGLPPRPACAGACGLRAPPAA